MITIDLLEASAVSEARRNAVTTAKSLGFDEKDAGKLAIVVTEIATNLVKHAGGGQIFLRPVEVGGAAAVEVLGIDSGPGMADVGACIRDGHSSAGSPGNGLGAISRLSANAEIHSLHDRGTIVRAVCVSGAVRPTPAVSGYEIGYILTPKPGQQVCGDGVAVVPISDGLRVMVSDGLGHGLPAAEASQAASEALRVTAGQELTAVMERMHHSLRGTRGAAIGVADIRYNDSSMQFCGIGNISGVIVSSEKTNHLVSMNGIVGHQIRSIRIFEYPWTTGSTLILHSDGISSRWDLRSYSGLHMWSPSVIAGLVYRDARRGTDDASVLVAAAR